MLAAVAINPVNHVLRCEAWAGKRLQKHSGKTICIKIPPLITLGMLIDAAGEMQPAENESNADTTLVLAHPVLFKLLAGDAKVFDQISTIGDQALAEELLDIGRQIDLSVIFENDLSNVVGDIPAHRISQTGKNFVQCQIDNVDRLTRSLKDYLTEETNILTKSVATRQLAEEIANLQMEAEALEQRLNRLTQRIFPLSE